MQVRIRIIVEDATGVGQMQDDIAHLERCELGPGSLGLSLAEAKALLAAAQRTIVSAQAEQHAVAARPCPCCGQPRATLRAHGVEPRTPSPQAAWPRREHIRGHTARSAHPGPGRRGRAGRRPGVGGAPSACAPRARRAPGIRVPRRRCAGARRVSSGAGRLTAASRCVEPASRRAPRRMPAPPPAGVPTGRAVSPSSEGSRFAG